MTAVTVRRRVFSPVDRTSNETKALFAVQRGMRVLWAAVEKNVLAAAGTTSTMTLGDGADVDGYVAAELDLETGAVGDLVNGAGAYLAASGGALSVTKPASTVDGDLLIAVVYWEGTGTTVTPPANWNTVTGYPVRNTNPTPDMAQWTFWKIAAGEGASFSFSASTSTDWRSIACYRYTGGTGDAGDHVDVASTPQQGTAANVTVTAVTTTIDSELVIVPLTNWTGNNWSRSSGADPTTNRRAGIGGCELFDGAQATAGSTGTGVYTAGTVDYAAGRVAFKDSAGGGGGPTVKALAALGVG